MTVNIIFNRIVQMSATAAFVIVFILFIRLFLKKVPAIYSYLLWFMVLFRLLCPVFIQSHLSVIPNLFLQEQTAVREIQNPQETGLLMENDFEFFQANNTDSVPKMEAVDYSRTIPAAGGWKMAAAGWISYIWLAGAGCLFFVSIVQFLRLRKNVRCGVRKLENISICETIETPFVLGLFHPRIYIPIALQNNSYVLQHEMVHIKRKDHLVKILFWFAVMIHWFNPLVWAAFALMNNDMEMSCDESVVKHYQKDMRLNYALELLTITVERQHGLFPGFREGNISKRIKNLLIDKKIPLALKVILPCLGIAISVILLSNPVKKQAEEIASLPANESFGQIDLAQHDFVKPAEWSMNTMLDTKIPDLDYASDERVIMHGYFGLFIYDLEKKKLDSSIDLKALGCQEVQGDGPCEVTVSEDGTMVWIRPFGAEFMYLYHVREKELEKVSYEIPDESFQKLQTSRGLLTDSTNLELHRCSGKTVDFLDGTYGYLYMGSGMLADIQYIRGADRWNLFTEEECTSPLLVKQDDSFYESFQQMAKKSFNDFSNAYTLMLKINDYYGVCRLSQKLEYSDEVQRSWKDADVSVSGRELENRGDRACYEIQLSVTNSQEGTLERGEHVRYLYAVNGEEGWYADGALRKELPPEGWWSGENR